MPEELHNSPKRNQPTRRSTFEIADWVEIGVALFAAIGVVVLVGGGLFLCLFLTCAVG